MLRKKYFKGILFTTTLILSLAISSCYTQLSRTQVDTEYYPTEDSEYESEYTEEETRDINYYDIYVYGGTPFLYGPHAWLYWSPYYRSYHHRDFYDPWWDDYHYWNIGIYDPFYDPWYGYRAYSDYYYYHPRHHYYWSYDREHKHSYSNTIRHRDDVRRNTLITTKTNKKRWTPTSDKTPKPEIEERIVRENVRDRSTPEVSRRKIVVPESRQTRNIEDNKTTKKESTRPARVEKRKVATTQPQSEKVKKSSPSKSSVTPQIKRSSTKESSSNKRSSSGQSKSSSSKKSSSDKSKS